MLFSRMLTRGGIMLIKQHPETLADIFPIDLVNYRLSYGYSVMYSWEKGRVRLRGTDRIVLYCLTKESAELVRCAAIYPDFYDVVQHCFLVYAYPEDPHAFCLDKLEGDFNAPCVHLYTDEEVRLFLERDELEFVHLPEKQVSSG
jgi:hypothetical protein